MSGDRSPPPNLVSRATGAAQSLRCVVPLVLLVLVGLAACGKKGPPEPPGPPEKVTYPKIYPTR